MTVTGLQTPRPPGQLEVRGPRPGRHRDGSAAPSQAAGGPAVSFNESNSLSGTCSGMDSTVWMKAQVLVYVFGIYLHASVYVLYVHVCVCMNTNLNKIWLSMECSYVYVYVCMH